MNNEVKNSIIKEYRLHDTDRGSIEIQIAVLTNRINDLNQNHLSKFPKDMSARHGLIKLVGQRRSFLAYLKRNSEAGYQSIIARLQIRK